MGSTLRCWLGLASIVCGCTDDRPNLPSPSFSGGSKVRGHNDTDMDAGDDANRDAAMSDAGDAAVPATSCERVTPVRSVGDDMIIVTSTSEPVDFLVTRQAERWTSDCTDPRLIIELSDGTCPDGFGHQLSIAFSLNDVADGAIHVGNNAIYSEGESTSIVMRYTRPEPLMPSGIWGTCTGADGQLIFDEAPDVTAGGFFQARYQVQLTDCDKGDNPPEMLSGMFRIQLRYELNEFCPTRTF